MKKCVTPKKAWETIWQALLVLAIAYTLASIFANVMNTGEDWAFKFTNNGTFFGDLRGLTAALQCNTEGINIYELDQNCVSERLPRFNYTLPSLHLLKAIHIKYENTEFLGAVLGISSIVFTCLFTAKLLKGYSAWIICATLILLSFPMQLAIERGNTDQLIFWGLAAYASIDLGSLNSRTSRAILAIVTFALTALKLFPFFTFFSHWAMHRSRRRLLLSLSPALLALSIQLPTLPYISANTPKGTGISSYGLLTTHKSILNNIAGDSINILPNILIFLKLIIIGAAIRYWLISKKLFKYMPSKESFYVQKNQASYIFFVVGALTFLSTYLLLINWDYRLLSIFLCIPFLVKTFLEKIEISNINQFSVFSLFCIFFISYQPYIVNQGLAILSDAIIQPLLFGSLFSFLIFSSRPTINIDQTEFVNATESNGNHH